MTKPCEGSQGLFRSRLNASAFAAGPRLWETWFETILSIKVGAYRSRKIIIRIKRFQLKVFGRNCWLSCDVIKNSKLVERGKQENPEKNS